MEKKRNFLFSVLFLLFLLLFFLCNIGIVYAECSSGQIDINSASAEELDKIIWIGPATAEKIINARPFDNVGSLIKVSGIGEVKVSDIIEEGLACVENEKQDSEEDESEVIADEPENKDNDRETEDNEDKQTDDEITGNIENNDKEEDEDDEQVIRLGEQDISAQVIKLGEDNSDSITNSKTNLITNKQDNRIIYKSRNEYIKEYAIYCFALLCVFIIILLIKER